MRNRTTKRNTKSLARARDDDLKSPIGELARVVGRSRNVDVQLPHAGRKGKIVDISEPSSAEKPHGRYALLEFKRRSVHHPRDLAAVPLSDLVLVGGETPPRHIYDQVVKGYQSPPLAEITFGRVHTHAVTEHFIAAQPVDRTPSDAALIRSIDNVFELARNRAAWARHFLDETITWLGLERAADTAYDRAYAREMRSFNERAAVRFQLASAQAYAVYERLLDRLMRQRRTHHIARVVQPAGCAMATAPKPVPKPVPKAGAPLDDERAFWRRRYDGALSTVLNLRRPHAGRMRAAAYLERVREHLDDVVKDVIPV